MAFTWEESPIGTGDTQCRRCGQLYFRGSGCENCRETAKASARIAERAVSPKRVESRPEEIWWLAIPNGTAGYSSPKDAAEHRNSVAWVPGGLYKMSRTRQREFNGYKSLISIPNDRYPDVWVNESPDDGVHRRKSRTDALMAIEKFRG